MGLASDEGTHDAHVYETFRRARGVILGHLSGSAVTAPFADTATKSDLCHPLRGIPVFRNRIWEG